MKLKYCQPFKSTHKSFYTFNFFHINVMGSCINTGWNCYMLSDEPAFAFLFPFLALPALSSSCRTHWDSHRLLNVKALLAALILWCKGVMGTALAATRKTVGVISCHLASTWGCLSVWAPPLPCTSSYSCLLVTLPDFPPVLLQWFSFSFGVV